MYLVPEYEDEEAAIAFIRRWRRQIFEDRLADWYIDKARWPRRRNYETFLEWFDVELHSLVIDACGGVIFKSYE